jgi:tRNA(Arg) A34 adenosine deaminase TadA
MMNRDADIRITFPPWVVRAVDWDRAYATPGERMRLAIELSRQNIEHGLGGPFGAAVFEEASGKLVSVGVNLVVAQNNSALHAEVVALMAAEQRIGRYSLRAVNGPFYEIVTSCDPCAMCLGAVLWSAVHRVTCGADREDARAIGFDEGPVFDESWAYLERQDIEVVRGVMREEAVDVLQLYRKRGGKIYNR